MRGQAVILFVLLAGCTSTTTSPPDPTREEPPAADGPEGAPVRAVDAPDLEVGLAWTYEGKEFYNDDTSFTVVVAEARPDGFLFAAGSEDDLVYEALWESRWYNVRDLDLDRAGWGRSLLEFPLADGLSWPYSEGLTLTASAQPVTTPLGADDAGFLIEGANDALSVRAEYSPLVGNLVSLLVLEADGDVRSELRMTKVERGRSWVWYELGGITAVSEREPGAIEVPEGYDHVIASAGGTTGGRARVVAPDGGSWEATFEGEETWRHGMLPATPGRWAAAVVGRPFVEGAPEVEWPVGWGYMHVAPIRWTRGAP